MKIWAMIFFFLSISGIAMPLTSAHSAQLCKFFSYQEKERNWCIIGNYDDHQNFVIKDITVRRSISAQVDAPSFDTRKNEITEFCSHFNFNRGLLKSKPPAESTANFTAIDKTGKTHSAANSEISCLASKEHPGPDVNTWTTSTQKKDILLGNAKCIHTSLTKNNNSVTLTIFLKYTDGHAVELHALTIPVESGSDDDLDPKMREKDVNEMNDVLVEIQNEGVCLDAAPFDPHHL